MCSESLFPRWALCYFNKLLSTCSVNRVDRSPTLEKCDFFMGGERETDCKHKQTRSLPVGMRALQAVGQVMWSGEHRLF